jgi:transcriptional regulator NrdR family protein
MKSDSEGPPNRGIECPNCGCRHFFTTHTEPLRDGRIRRRKVCRHCDRKMVTYESPNGSPPKSRC